jgi:ADP-ribose pyrophosphatase YjhB (NUDIX family)
MESTQDRAWAPERSGRMRVKVRAVMVNHEGLIVVPERRGGEHSHFTLPGGRVDRSETVADALAREVHEETGLEVVVQQLLYVAEVTPRYGPQDLNLVFLASPLEELDFDRLTVVDLRRDDHPLVLPPILADIERDLALRWLDTPRWLGNVWQDPGEMHRPG